MAVSFCARFLLQLALLGFLLLLGGGSSTHGHDLEVGFYEHSCPDAEAIVRKTVESYFSQDATVTAPLLRLHFHDCFVRGCDGSVLLNSSDTNVAEKDAPPNLSLDAFYVIDAAKAALEAACPGIVSCADILAIAARDAVSLAIGTSAAHDKIYEVETGRRDGVVSKATEALSNLPSSYADISDLKINFSAKGLSAKDLAILSGAHAIGNSHCSSFDKRLYNYSTGADGVDPTLDRSYALKLREACKSGSGTVVEMVPASSTSFDTQYYQNVAKSMGLFHSDAALLQDEETRAYVYARLRAPASSFFSDFGKSMVRMGRAQVLTGDAGEIRKNCAVINN